MSTAPIQCHDISKFYGALAAVEDVSLTVPAGSILTLIGPSGCGKTTVLRLVAGFERPDQGEIFVGQQQVAGPGRHLPPEQRRIGMVFQDYAIFPHLSVAKNIAFGLNNKASKEEKAARVEELLSFVGLELMGERLPHELSGGQQQRVALARALAPGPRALLLDEPFSNLDAALRGEVRAEVKELLQRSGTTTIFVTHDQEEALFFGDLVAVMRAGRMEQVGTPEEIYLQPSSRFVAAFMGQSDFITGQVISGGVETPLGCLHLETMLAPGTPLEIASRPNQVALTLDEPHNGRIVSRQFLGIACLYGVALGDGSIVRSWQPHQFDLSPGMSIQARFRPGRLPPMFLNGRPVEEVYRTGATS